MKLLKLFVNQFPLPQAQPVLTSTDVIFHAACQAVIDTVDYIEFEYTTENVPQSGKGIYKMYQDAFAGVGTFRIFSGANAAKDLYFSPKTNLAYRAVHDLDHVAHYMEGRGTTSKASELYLNCLMAKRVYSYALSHGYTRKQAMLAFFEIYHDTVGQVHYYFEHNDFCVDQKALTTKLVSECRGCKAVLADDLMTASIEMQHMLRECGVNFKLMGGV